MGNGCFPGPTVTSVGCAYDQREAAREQERSCLRSVWGSQPQNQLIQPPSTPMGRGQKDYPHFTDEDTVTKRQLLSVSVILSPLSLPLCICLYLCLSASLSLHLCVSLGVSVSVPTLPTHRVLGIQQCPPPCLGLHHEMGMAPQDPAVR